MPITLYYPRVTPHYPYFILDYPYAIPRCTVLLILILYNSHTDSYYPSFFQYFPVFHTSSRTIRTPILFYSHFILYCPRFELYKSTDRNSLRFYGTLRAPLPTMTAFHTSLSALHLVPFALLVLCDICQRKTKSINADKNCSCVTRTVLSAPTITQTNFRFEASSIISTSVCDRIIHTPTSPVRTSNALRPMFTDL